MEDKLVIDRKNWRRGEWDNEPDRVDFIHAGFSCFIQRGPVGSWCGYVGVPSNHPSYEKHYNDVNVDVHGGLTYANKCNGHICHVPESGMPDDVWWLGFDMAHHMDYSPGMAQYDIGNRGMYRNMAYATHETKQLAEQLEVMK